MRIAVVGASGLVGRLVVEMLFERGFADEDVVAYGSRAHTLSIAGRDVLVRPIPDDGRVDAGIVVSSTPDDVARRLVPLWLAQGRTVIDESAAWRHDARAALVTIGVNDEVLDESRRLFAGPNCTTIQIALAVAGLHRAYGVEDLVVSTYQAASGAGREGLLALESGDPSVFGSSLPGTVIPRIGREDSDGTTSEERKLARELPVLLDAPIAVRATCVRVPVPVGHGASVWIRTARTIDDAFGVLDAAPGVRRIDGAPGPREVAGTDDVIVARVRRHGERELSLWCVADNLRVGAATNVVRIVQRLGLRPSAPARLPPRSE